MTSSQQSICQSLEIFVGKDMSKLRTNLHEIHISRTLTVTEEVLVLGSLTTRVSNHGRPPINNSLSLATTGLWKKQRHTNYLGNHWKQQWQNIEVLFWKPSFTRVSQKQHLTVICRLFPQQTSDDKCVHIFNMGITSGR